MRLAFIETLSTLAEQNANIWLLTGDLGFSVLEPFARQFGERYVNVGVAEQNMTGIAAGLALSGKTVFTYSIANFPLFRCLEQIRNDICYHNLNVKVVAVGGGLAYGTAGYSHHALEDLAIMRALPNMIVAAPGDPIETRLVTRAIVEHNGPCYLRLGKSREPVVHLSEPNFVLGKSIKLREGTDLVFVSTGGILATVMNAANSLEQKGYSIGVISMPTISPIDEEMIVNCAHSPGRIITVEEHASGGLGSVVAEILCGSGRPTQFKSISVRGYRFDQLGSQEALKALYGLSAEALEALAIEMISTGSRF
ncbi:MAG TPA: transketolase C-terminal domain-containing protein [Anaerolineales bacterium]|nr:transketolase C-terminal domain-containing protein [Anaerolineales bacterium]